MHSSIIPSIHHPFGQTGLLIYTYTHLLRYRQTDRQTERQTDRHTHTHTHTWVPYLRVGRANTECTDVREAKSAKSGSTETSRAFTGTAITSASAVVDRFGGDKSGRSRRLHNCCLGGATCAIQAYTGAPPALLNASPGGASGAGDGDQGGSTVGCRMWALPVAGGSMSRMAWRRMRRNATARRSRAFRLCRHLAGECGRNTTGTVRKQCRWRSGLCVLFSGETRTNGWTREHVRGAHTCTYVHIRGYVGPGCQGAGSTTPVNI